MILPKKKRIMILVATIGLIALIAIGLLLYVSLGTDSLKSNSELFEKYMLSAFENVEEFSKFEKDDRLEKNKYESNMQIKLNYTKNIDTTDKNQNNNLNSSVLNIDSQVDNVTKYDYKLLSLYKDSEQIGKIEFVRNDNTYGVHIPGIKQYISIKNGNLKETLNSEMLSEEQKKLIPDSIPELKFDISELEFTKEEKEQLVSRYKKIIDENTTKENFTKQNNALVTIDKKDVNVNSYTLSLPKESYNNLRIKILEQLKDDEIILNKIEKIQKKSNELYINNIDYKTNFVEYMEKTIKNIKDTNIGQEEVKVTVSVKNKKTVKLSIDDKQTKTVIDFIGENPNQTIKITSTKADITEDETDITLSKKKEDNKKTLNIDYMRIKDQKTDEFQLGISNEEQNGTINNKYNVSYNNGKNKIELNTEENIKFVEAFSKDINYDGNNIVLNDVDDNAKKRIFNAIIEKGGQQLNLISNNIKLADIIDIFSMVDTGESISLEDNGTTEKDKERFNAQFEFYQGEEIGINDIEQLLSLLEENSSNAQIITNEKDKIEIKIAIESGKSDLTGIKKVSELLNDKDNKNKKYNLSFGYSNEGVINEALISYTKK